MKREIAHQLFLNNGENKTSSATLIEAKTRTKKYFYNISMLMMATIDDECDAKKKNSNNDSFVVVGGAVCMCFCMSLYSGMVFGFSSLSLSRFSVGICVEYTSLFRLRTLDTLFFCYVDVLSRYISLFLSHSLSFSVSVYHFRRISFNFYYFF